MTQKLHLFLVEDDEDTALLMRRSLERSGFQVTTCRSAADALTVLGTSTFDLILLDQRLPDMTGVELLQTLNQEGIAVPVLMVTGYGDEQLVAQVLRAGALDYLVKDHRQNYLEELPKRVQECYSSFRLQQTNRLLGAALESAQDGIMITDLQGTINHVNRALEEMTGYSREELIGKNPRILKSGVHEPETYDKLWRTILARNSWQGELTNRRKDGTPYEVSVSISPIVDGQGRLTHFVGIQRDISDVKQLQQQLLQAQKMHSVGTLAGGVAHEFNNILAGISGYAALGARECHEPVLREFFQNIVELGDRAAALTRQLLAFARRAALRRQPVVLHELVRNTVNMLARTLRHELVNQPEVRPPDGTPLRVEADANQLQQALMNLVLNARDAMSGGGTITLSLQHRPAGNHVAAYPENIPAGDYAVISVSDQGCGMTPQVLSQALDPFFTTKDVGQGTGLGLPLVYGIVRGHNGYLDIQTVPGAGTTVSLYLPRLGPAQMHPDSKPEIGGEILEPEHGPGCHVLVIDDEPAVQQVVRRFLEIAGHRVTSAFSAAEGLSYLDQNSDKLDLVLLDWLMPREDGSVALRRIRESYSQLPVVVMSGYLPEELAHSLTEEGAAGVLRKPFRMNELWYAVNQALQVPAPVGKE